MTCFMVNCRMLIEAVLRASKMRERRIRTFGQHVKDAREILKIAPETLVAMGTNSLGEQFTLDQLVDIESDKLVPSKYVLGFLCEELNISATTTYIITNIIPHGWILRDVRVEPSILPNFSGRMHKEEYSWTLEKIKPVEDNHFDPRELRNGCILIAFGVVGLVILLSFIPFHFK